MHLQRRARALQFVLLCCGVVVVSSAGCGYPTTQPMNMEVISSLRTALSARNEQWLAANEEIVEKRHAAGEMRDDEYNAFIKIIRRARDGDWVGAERASLEFQRAQRPTDEQIQKIREFHAK